MKTMPGLLFPLYLAVATITACGGGGGSSQPAVATPATALPPPPPADPELRPAAAQGQYAGVLVDCVEASSAGESCPLTTLPLLGQQTGNPTVDDVLARTVISHEWMATRLREVLQVLPADILSLMQAVTAVVVAGDIRPSYYSPRTGAIHIDPAHLWLTNDEKASISRDPDYRADFAHDLAFVSLYRYVAGTGYAWDYFDLGGFETRALGDIEKPVAAMLFHELAHANDAFPPNEIPGLDRSLSFADALLSIEERQISRQLAAFQPLTSQLWMDLAAVMYEGAIATTAQRQLSASQVGLELENDGASDDYAYTDHWEDLAMLFEEVMMHHHYGIDREIAYTNMPTGDDTNYCDFYIIRWGVRNRVGDPLVLSRAEFGLQLLLDRADVSPYLDAVPTQWHMAENRNWCSIQPRADAPGQFAAKPGATTQSARSAGTRMRPDAFTIGHL